MKVSLALFLLIFATNVLAQGAAVPHQFSNGNAVVASEFNANFQDLANRNNGTQAQVTQNANNISALQSSLNNVEGAVSQIQTDLTSIQSAGSAAPLLQYVGNSSATVDGGQGMRSMIEACQADYPESRVCTSEEYVKTVNLPATTPLADSWILFTEILNPTEQQKRERYATNINRQFVYDFNCLGWSDNTSQIRALMVKPNGTFSSGICATAAPVSCCK